jgi:hypothetical protein
MKRILYASALATLILMSGIAVAQEDLGAMARQQRQQKKPTAKRVYTNDDLATQSSAPAPGPAADAKPATDAKAEAPKPKGPSADDKAKAQAALQSQVNARKAEIATLTRELEIADRENRLRVANYYADAGNSLRDPRKFQDEQKAKEDEIAGKKKAIEEGKAKLADVIEQGRKAGLTVE